MTHELQAKLEELRLQELERGSPKVADEIATLLDYAKEEAGFCPLCGSDGY
jgi:hypothetical protein